MSPPYDFTTERSAEVHAGFGCEKQRVPIIVYIGDFCAFAIPIEYKCYVYVYIEAFVAA